MGLKIVVEKNVDVWHDVEMEERKNIEKKKSDETIKKTICRVIKINIAQE